MNLVLIIMAVVSPNGDAEINWEDCPISSGITADMLMSSFAIDTKGTSLEPGELPEGDYLYDLEFTADGQRVLIANYMTGNLSLVDPTALSVVADIPTGGMLPGAVGCCTGYNVVTFPFDDKATVTDATGSILGTVDTGEQPWKVRFSPDGQTAYIACDIDDCVTVVDLATQTVNATIPDFPFWLQTYGWGSESPRQYVKFSGFEVTNDGVYLAAPGDDGILFYNTSTGAVDHTVSMTDAASVGLSGDGNFLVAVSASTDVTLHRIDLSSFTIVSSVTVTGSSLGMAKEVAVNQDGTKAFISTSGNTSTLVNFTSQDFTQFSSTYSAFWTAPNHDHTLAISGQYRFSIIDFESETMVAQHAGNSQYFGAVSPVANVAAGTDPMGFEGIYLYSFSGSSVTYDGSVYSGSPVESDAPRRVAISPDGKWAVLTSTLSDNASLVDLAAGQVVAILEMGDRVQNVEFTPDSRYAVVCTFNGNSVKLIDTETATVAANVPAGTRAGNVEISPDGSMACVANISANTVSFIELNGAASTEVAERSCGVIGVSWAAYGVQSDLAISPDGSLLLVCDSFNDNVLLFDMNTYDQIASIAVADFPLRAEFNGDGTRAMVTCLNADKVCLLEIDGASSSLLGSWNSGDGPLRMDYDQANDRFGVGLYFDNQIKFYDAQTGDLTGIENYSGHVLQPMFTQDGEVMALVASTSSSSSRLYRGTSFEDLPAGGCTFDFCDATNTAVVAIPGPDMAYIVSYGSQGTQGGYSVDLGSCVAVNPNPVTGSASFSFSLPGNAQGVLSIYDMSGRMVTELASGEFIAGENTFTSSLDILPSGVYTVRCTWEGGSLSGRFAVIR